MIENLPEEWVETTLGEIADWSSGGTPDTKKKEYYDGNIPWVVTGDLTDGLVNASQKKITQAGLENSSAKWVQPGSVMIAMYGASIGRLGIADFECTTNQAIAYTKRLYGGISNRFLFYYLQKSKADFVNLGAGGAQPNISQTVLKEFPIPLPPLAEQARIVAALDGLLGRVRAAQEALGAVPKLLKCFRQAVLSAAVSGKLTEEWRDTNDNKEIWVDLTAAEACDAVASGSTPKGKPFFENEEIPYLKVYNIVNQKINFQYKPQYIKREIHEKELKRCKVYPNDVIINIVGPPLGKVAIIPNDYEEWNINQAIVLFRTKREIISSEFLYLVFCEGTHFREIETETRGTVGQVNISLSQCRAFILRIPPLAEQQEIVRRVGELLALADGVEARYRAAQRQLDALPQACLAKAFAGHLTERHPDDEPTALLLERLRAGRAAPAAPPPKPKRGRKAGKQFTLFTPEEPHF